MISLDEALDRLVHVRSYRQLFVQGRDAELGVSDETLEDLRSIEPRALLDLARRIAEQVLTRTHSGAGSIFDLYPLTVAAFYRAREDVLDPQELAYAFMESPAFSGYLELPFSGVGLSLEEAFYRFAEEQSIGEAADREREFHGAMMKLLAVSARAAIILPECIRRTAHGFFCVTETAPPTLHAAVSGRLVNGPLTPFLADLLAVDAVPVAVAARHGVTARVLTAAVSRLSELGILGS